MTQDNTYNINPNNPQPQIPETPPVANPLNTGNGGFETPATETPSPEAVFPQVPTPEATTPEVQESETAAPQTAFPQVTSAEMPENQPHPIEIQSAPVTEIPAAESQQSAAEVQQPVTETAPAFPSQPTAEAPQPPVVPSITDSVQSGESMPMPNTETTHQESKVKSYIIASVLVVGLSTISYIGYKFFLNSNTNISAENATEESVEFTNSLTPSTTSEEKQTDSKDIFATEEAQVTEEVDKMKELDEVVNELKEIYSPESKVSEEAILSEISGEESGVDR